MQKRAIAYYRHSAEDKQENSVAIQQQHARTFANKHKIKIVHEEADEGVSGLQANRSGFQNLIQEWILNSTAPHFEYVLVYDVSRWGRFQDQDEAGYYEFLCRKSGKQIIYIDQGFPRHGTELTSSLLTSLHRYMAAEYSRQLSSKVFHGSAEISKQGYLTGGSPPYGLSRLLLDANKKPIRVLRSGEHKQIANERVTLTSSHDETSDTVKKIFQWFTYEKLSLVEVRNRLNQHKIAAPASKQWNVEKVRRILGNPAYIGTRVYNKTSNRLKKGWRRNPKSKWIITNNAFENLVSSKCFKLTQKKLHNLQTTHQSTSPIKQARKIVNNHLKKLLEPVNASKNCSLETIPITLSVTRQTPSRTWCFISPPTTNHSQYILAAGIKKDANHKKKAIIEELFYFPLTIFQNSPVLILSEGDEIYRRYRTDEQKFNKAVVKIAIQRT